MSGNFAIRGGVGRLMANAILNFLFDFSAPFPKRYGVSQLVSLLNVTESVS